MQEVLNVLSLILSELKKQSEMLENLVTENTQVIVDNAFTAQAKEIIDCLNSLAGTRFKNTRVNLDFVIARLKEGYRQDELMEVIAFMVKEWSDDKKMKKYLRPSTLFNNKNFNQYFGISKL